MRAIVTLVVLALLGHAAADVYLHNPRGSNNRLAEQSATRTNANRLFNSQNNNRGGYNVGVRGATATGITDGALDLTLSAAELNNLYNTPSQPTAAGAGALNGRIYPMTYYDGSILEVEWTNQHGCGGNEATDPSPVNCNIILQYMCDTDDTQGTYAQPHMAAMRVHLKDGQVTDTPTEPTTFADATSKDAETTTTTGRHESAFYYQECKTRKRDSGLFTADQQLHGSDSRFTRQNPNGERRGFECPEERDYYPYAFSPWIDVAHMVDQLPTSQVCSSLQTKSPNVATYYKCFASATQTVDSAGYTAAIAARTFTACNATGGVWQGFTHSKPAPDCISAIWSRENHLGNTNAEQPTITNVNTPPQPARYKWKLPTWAQLTTGNTIAKVYTATDNSQYARCVFRLRYNISTDDYDPFNTNSSSNQNGQTGQRSPIQQNPTVDIAADLAPVRLAIDTAQTGRVFQDRSHSFTIKNSASLPTPLPAGGKIYNLNVRGKRGNIVQTFPAVEYDFIPNVLQVSTNDLIHVQWTGSNTHNNGHPGGDGQTGDAGEGTGGTDRNNIVAFPDTQSNYPIPNTAYGTLTTGSLLSNAQCYSVMDAATMTQYDCQIRLASSGFYTSQAQFENNALTTMDSLLNNAEPTLVSGVLLRMSQPGAYYYGCTRNNNFSNRSQKGVVVVN